MLNIFADALLIAARQDPLPWRHPMSERNAQIERQVRRKWFSFAGIRL
jgi:hypothetical protein